MNKIADNINGILDFAVFALRFFVVCCVRHSAPVFAFQSWDTNGFWTLQMPLVCIFQIKLCVCKSKAIHLFQKRKLLFVFGRRRNKKVPASSRNCCASISIWFQIKRTQPKVLANRTCCSDVGYARYFIALFSFCTGTAVTTFYYLVYSVRTLYLLKSVAIHPPHK